MKTLIFLRHAKSSWDSGAAGDHDRPLAARGRRDAPTVGKAAKRAKLDLDIVVCSTATRARETLALFADSSGYAGEIVFDERVYGADVDELLEVVAGLPERARCAMLVGHNPGFEETIGALCGGARGARVRVPTATLACLALDGEWRSVARGGAALLWMLVPKIL